MRKRSSLCAAEVTPPLKSPRQQQQQQQPTTSADCCSHSDSRSTVTMESTPATASAHPQPDGADNNTRYIITKYEEEIHRLQNLVSDKDEQILKLSRDNAELSTKLHMHESIISTFQTRLDKVDALVSVHDKAIVSVKDNIQGLTYRLANLPLETAVAAAAKDSRKIQSMPMGGYIPPPPPRSQFTTMVNTAPSEPVSIVLIGDATFKYIDEEHLFNKMAKCNKVIVNSIDEAKPILGGVVSGERPTCLVLHLGTRDVEYDNSDVCAQKMLECVRMVKELTPETQMCISLLLPRGDSEPNKVKAQLFNFKVQELLAHESVHFIIHSELEKDGRLITKYYQPDFININGLDGSRKLAAHLKHGIRRAVPSLQPQPAQGPY